jgi:hypothetical protein
LPTILPKPLSPILIFEVTVLLCSTSLLAKAQHSDRPPLSTPPADNAWDYFCNPDHQDDLSDRLKCIQIGSQTQLSVSGELRTRGEYFDHTVLGSDSPSSGYLLQRYLLSTDLMVGDHVRFFSTLESGIENGRLGGPRPSIDEDRLFVHEAFLELRSRRQRPALDLRIGRHDLIFGSGRLIGNRELPNVQQNFDGIRLIVATGSWQTNFFAVRPSLNLAGIFDDVPDHTSALWGVYVTRKRHSATLDLYYFGTDHKSVRFQAATGREQRKTLGARFADARGGWDYDSEFVFQFGSFAGRPIKAWTATTYTGYTLTRHSSSTQYRLAVDTGVASGNRNGVQGTFGTFNALFPRGAYFGYANFIGPYNVIALRPSFRITFPSLHLTIWPNVESLWRQSRNDGVYSIPGLLVQPGSPQSALSIGFQSDLNITWEQNRNISWNIDGEHFLPGQFLKETTAGRSVNYISAGVSYRF